MLDFLHHLFLPRESNNHRSKLLHHESILLVIAVLLFGTTALSTVQHSYPAVLGISTNMSVQELLTLTNQKRQENGLAPLKLNDQLSQAAAMKAQYMFAKNYWAHIAPDGTTPWYFIKNAKYEYLYAGENLARGFTTAPDVVNAWMASPSHRENMLSPNYNDIGFAVSTGSLTGSDTVLVVQMFGSPYISKDEFAPSPTPIAIQLIPTVALQQAILPTAPQSTQTTPSLTGPTQVLPTSQASVAAVQNQPLINTPSMTKQIAIFLLILFISVFVLDAIIIERKKIVRVVSHNLDHIIFLIIILLTVIIIGKGLVL